MEIGTGNKFLEEGAIGDAITGDVRLLAENIRIADIYVHKIHVFPGQNSIRNSPNFKMHWLPILVFEGHLAHKFSHRFIGFMGGVLEVRAGLSGWNAWPLFIWHSWLCGSGIEFSGFVVDRRKVNPLPNVVGYSAPSIGNVKFNLDIEKFSGDYRGLKVLDHQPSSLLSFAIFQLPLHRLPLFFRVVNVEKSQNDKNYSSYSSNSPMVYIKEFEWPKKDAQGCYKEPAYFCGMVAIIIGLLMFLSAGACWQFVTQRRDDWRSFFVLLSGFFFLYMCFIFFRFALGVIEFNVAPCAT